MYKHNGRGVNMTNKKSELWIVAIVFWGLNATLAQNSLTVEDIFGTSKYASKTLRGVQWIPDGRAITYYETDDEGDGKRIMLYDVKSGKRSVLINSETTEALGSPGYEKRHLIRNYHWSPTGKHILLPSGNDLYLFDVKSKKVRKLTEDDAEERDPAFSPDGNKIAYLKHHNLTVLDLNTGEEMQVTTHGTKDLLIGRFDWVYEEEFGIRTGFFWSPDSKRLAYFEVDQSGENEFPIVDFIPIHNTCSWMRYPKAGDANAVVRIGVVPALGGETVWMDIGQETDIYIPRIGWLPESKHVVIQRMNRDQNHLELLFADASTGSSEGVLTETDTEGWLYANDDLTLLKGKPQFVWSSERSNWVHLYLCDYNGKVIRQLTDGEWDVTQLVYVDEKNGVAYFMATEKSSIERHFYRIGLNGKGFRRLSPETGWHGIDMSPDGKYYLDMHSDVSTPPKTALYQNDGKKVRIVESGEIEALKDVELSVPEFFTLTTDDGPALNAYIIKPPDFDPSMKYPVIVYTYGGPNSQTVRNGWRGNQGLWYQILLEKGFILFGVDNRGTGYKGNDFMNIVYRNMGLGLTDQINGAKYLRSLPYVDGQRIGIWGWSGGGWMTCMAMTKGGGHFKAGVAVAPVSDFRNYDTIWTERYMDQPRDNPEGYDASNPINFIDNYRGGLLLIHGDADDNVHVSNTIQMAFALQNARKPFDMMIYPQKLHGIGGQDTQVHLFNKITNFFLDEL